MKVFAIPLLNPHKHFPSRTKKDIESPYLLRKPLLQLSWRLLFFLPLVSFAAQPPRLVIGIVIDQMRADYLRRFSYKRGGGLYRLLEEGLIYWNCHYTYFPTYTGPGHASIYTGATPAYHGIVANTWYERSLRRPYYCVADSSVRTIGTASSAGQRSPRTLWASTITDELRYASRFRSKVISIALKDRSAILPAGHAPTIALWFDSKEGVWITSSYYADTLPRWVQEFNARRYPDSLLRVPWLLTRSHACTDESPYEGKVGGTVTFPHQPTSYEELLLTPAGNWLTLQLAQRAIEAENLGRQKGITDFLAISLSSPDLIGHTFGTESCELEETYEVLDKQLGAFLDYISRKFRQEEVLVFLTADHGAAPTPEALAEKGWNTGRYPEKALLAEAQAYLRKMLQLADTTYPIQAYMNQNFYLADWLSLSQKKEARALLKEWLLQQKFITYAYTAEELAGPGGSSFPFQRLQAGFLPYRSGDVIVVYAPGWIEAESYAVGTTHGSIWTYDTHVPLIWWGGGIRPAHSYAQVPITAIAPTLAFILRTPLPSAAFSAPLTEVIEAWQVPPIEERP
ncbi:MAG: alkaline phosphatase family protein [Bacteroidia bacterium]|nr:alkaline phosphatase family protein [Bacteroidia bacterium]